MNYIQFLESKAIVHKTAGIDVPQERISPFLYDFQRDITRWALRKGRAALFCDCGLGKTPMQLEFAKHVPGKVLIVAPLAVAQQTEREGIKFDIPAKYARAPIDEKITVTNYDMLEHFNPHDYMGVILGNYIHDNWEELNG